MAARVPIRIPPEVQALLEQLANAEQRVPEEVLKTAVEQYANSLQLQVLANWGAEFARNNGFKEADVLPAIQAVRAEKMKNSEQ